MMIWSILNAYFENLYALKFFPFKYAYLDS